MLCLLCLLRDAHPLWPVNIRIIPWLVSGPFDSPLHFPPFILEEWRPVWGLFFEHLGLKSPWCLHFYTTCGAIVWWIPVLCNHPLTWLTHWRQDFHCQSKTSFGARFIHQDQGEMFCGLQHVWSAKKSMYLLFWTQKNTETMEVLLSTKKTKKAGRRDAAFSGCLTPLGAYFTTAARTTRCQVRRGLDGDVWTKFKMGS